MNSLNRILTATALSGALLTLPAMAEEQGSLGTTSTGKSDVSLTIADRVQITGMDNIPLGTYSDTGDLVYNEAYCVYRNGAGNYKVNVTTDDAEFKVVSANASDNVTSAATTDCGGGDSGAIEIKLTEADLQAAQTANDYTATITILVTPT